MSTAPLTNRDRLVAQARRLFAENGFAAVSVDEVAAAAGLTKGAVYYQFKDKTDLFRAACEAVMADVARYVDLSTMAESPHPLEEIVIGGAKMFDAYEAADARRLLLIDGPSVLGFEQWTALQEPVCIGLIAHAMGHLAEAGLLDEAIVPTLSHLVFGAFVQGALRIAVAADPAAASLEVRAATLTLIRGFLVGVTHQAQAQSPP
ncbi:TetR/AcrR family transcriptional regulator [Phenylobacterium sp.]|uniref:TetR/AcrR family transcriptional regulator n=1 Tax=Phenylobacterium sp. TaxID=1871053 RepID=UPI002ED96B1A